MKTITIFKTKVKPKAKVRRKARNNWRLDQFE
jgi:hypothetical protein